MKKECRQPFTAVEIDINGDVYTCCPSYINNYKIGNIFNSTSIDDIWNSKNAKELRNKIINSDYSLCNLELCRQKKTQPINELIDLNSLPEYITLAYDKECNLQCITCRDEKYKNTLETKKLFDEKIDSKLVPLLKEAKIVALSGSGEAFFSSHSRKLIKKIAKENRNIKFNINTNGLLFNEANCKTLGITNRINEVFVSLPALNEKIYNKIMIGSNLKIVKKNIEWMSEQQKTNQINKISINTVISDLNYKEISKLVKFAKSLNIYITISQYYHWETKFGTDYDAVAVWEKNHKNHIKFIKELKKINYDKCFLSPLFRELKDTKLTFWEKFA